MGVRITSAENVVALFDSVSGFAFGPTFEDEDEASEFLSFLSRETDRDPRALNDSEIGELYRRFVWAGV